MKRPGTIESFLNSKWSCRRHVPAEEKLNETGVRLETCQRQSLTQLAYQTGIIGTKLYRTVAFVSLVVQQLVSQPLQHRLWNMTKFVNCYLCGVYGREIYATIVLLSGDCLQISWYVNSHDNWFPILFYKVDVKLDVWCAMNIARIIWPIWLQKFYKVDVKLDVWCAMNIARIIWPIWLQNNEFPPVCYTLWHHFLHTCHVARDCVLFSAR